MSNKSLAESADNTNPGDGISVDATNGGGR
jgi:hypothetical protein